MSYAVQKITPLAGWREIYRTTKVESAHEYIRKEVGKGQRVTKFRICEVVMKESLKEIPFAF